MELDPAALAALAAATLLRDFYRNFSGVVKANNKAVADAVASVAAHVVARVAEQSEPVVCSASKHIKYFLARKAGPRPVFLVFARLTLRTRSAGERRCSWC